MVKVQLGELKGIIEGLEEIGSVKLPVKTAYWVGKLARLVMKEFQDFEEGRMKLLKEFAQLGQDGAPVIENNSYVLSDAGGFAKAYTDLATVEVEFDMRPFALEQFGDVDVSPMALVKLNKFITEDAG